MDPVLAPLRDLAWATGLSSMGFWVGSINVPLLRSGADAVVVGESLNVNATGVVPGQASQLVKYLD